MNMGQPSIRFKISKTHTHTQQNSPVIIPVWSLNPGKLQSQLLRVKPQELWCCGCQPCGLHPCWLFLYALNRTAQGSEASWLKHHCPPFLWELDCSLGWDWIGDHFISQCPARPLPLTQSSSRRFICGCYLFFIHPRVSGERVRQPCPSGSNIQLKKTEYISSFFLHLVLKHSQRLHFHIQDWLSSSFVWQSSHKGPTTAVSRDRLPLFLFL